MIHYYYLAILNSSHSHSRTFTTDALTISEYDRDVAGCCRTVRLERCVGGFYIKHTREAEKPIDDANGPW